ncbi:MAG: hypothetical protein IT479_02635 [Xanthomonadales bacterium]|nr:hypothetical protein [Xanthomonadales bacterium]
MNASRETMGAWGGLLLAWLGLVASSSWAAPGRWSSAGPYGGRVDSAVAGTGEPGVVYASAHRSVYRSTNAGQSWSPAFAGLSTLLPGETVLAAHPTVPRLLALAGARGVFLSFNGARTWVRRDLGLPVGTVGFRSVDVEFASGAPMRLYLASADHGLYRSDNGGLSWTAVGGATLPSDLDRIAVDPANPDVVLAWALERNGGFPTSLYRSVDGGNSFIGIPGPWDFGGPLEDPLDLLDFARNTPGTVFLSGAFGNFRSLDGGASFSTLGTLPQGNTQRLHSLAPDPSDPGRIVFGSSEGVLLTVDNGTSFLPRNGGLSNSAFDPASIGPVLIDAVDPDRWLAFSRSGEVFRSQNAGLGWSASSEGLRGTTVQTLVVHPARPQRVYAGLRNLRLESTSPALFISDDDAQHWQRSNASLALDTVNALAFDPGAVAVPTLTRIYVGGADFAPLGDPPTSYRGGVFRSQDGGLSWQPVDNLVPMPAGGPAATGEVTALLVDPDSVELGAAQALYFAAHGLVRCIGGTPTLEVARLWRSSSAAFSWTARDGLPPGSCTPRLHYPLPTSLAFDPGDTQVIYAGTRLAGYCRDCGDPLPTIIGGVWKSVDAGLNWTPVNNGLPRMSGSGGTLDVLALAAVPGVPGALYAALVDPSVAESQGRVYKTVDGGANWFPADDGIVGLTVRALLIDPDTPNRVYAGVAGIETTPGGVYVSNDGGQNWDSISIDLPVDSAQALGLSAPAGNPPILHAGTDEGVWSLTRVPDGDIDGPPDATEDAAPNGGDGNEDGTPDRLQTGVASFEIPADFLGVFRGGNRKGTVSDSELDIEGGGGCQEVRDVAAIDPLGLPEDLDWSADAGIVRFEYIDCTAIDVELRFHDEVFGPEWRFRRFGPGAAANVLTLGWLSMGNSASRSGNTWTLQLVDNSPGDLRREVGRILFIGAPARPLPLHANGFE